MNKKTNTPPLGQHLLTSKDIAKSVTLAAYVTDGDTVLEVGPGKGMLTQELLELGASVVAVEKDPGMVSTLKEDFGNEITNKKLVVLEKDIRDVPISTLVKTSYKVVANIPYYITGELLRFFLTSDPQPTMVSLLVQKEVAERIARSEKESILSLSVKVYGSPRYIKTVKAGSFNPPPKVDSAILAVEDISRKNFEQISEEHFFKLVKVGFGQKRKTLLGNLKRELVIDSEKLEHAWRVLNLDTKVRAEDVPLKTWLQLTKLTSN